MERSIYSLTFPFSSHPDVPFQISLKSLKKLTHLTIKIFFWVGQSGEKNIRICDFPGSLEILRIPGNSLFSSSEIASL